MKCEICGKSPSTGFNISHSKRHTKRTWEPNVHPATISIGGKTKHMKICTRCQRTLSKPARP